MIYCSNCGVANREGSRFCNECGSRLGAMLPCPFCGLPNLSSSRFCNFCGRKLPFGDANVTTPSPIADAAVSSPATEDQCVFRNDPPIEPKTEQFEDAESVKEDFEGVTQRDQAEVQLERLENEVTVDVIETEDVGESEVATIVATSVPVTVLDDADGEDVEMAEDTVVDDVEVETEHDHCLADDSAGAECTAIDDGSAVARDPESEPGEEDDGGEDLVSLDWLSMDVDAKEEVSGAIVTSQDKVAEGAVPAQVVATVPVTGDESHSEPNGVDEPREAVPELQAQAQAQAQGEGQGPSCVLAELGAEPEGGHGAREMITIAHSLASPRTETRTEEDGAQPLAEAEALFISVIDPPPNLVGVEQFRRVVKRGLFGW